MAFDTETLSKLGLNEEQVKGVMAEYGATLNPLKDELQSAKSESEGLKTQLTDYEKQLSDAKKQVETGSEAAKQVDDLQKQLEESKSNFTKQLETTKLNYAISNALAKAGAKNEKAARALLDEEKISFDENGGIIGLNDQLENLKKEESSAFLFGGNGQEEKKPRINPVAGGNPSSGENDSVADLGSMSYKEQLKLKQEDPDGYAKAVKNQD